MSEEKKPEEAGNPQGKTEEILEAIAKNPPEPMLKPEERAQIQVPEKPETGIPPPRKLEKKDFSRLKDYKGRNFDPSIHEVDANEVPVLNGDGSLKIMRGKNGVIREAVERVAARIFPPSDHELAQASPEKAVAQALSIADHEDATQSAENAAEITALAQSLILGAEVYSKFDKRKPRLVRAWSRWEMRTGKKIAADPHSELLAQIFADTREIIATEPECKKRWQSFTSGARTAISAVVKQKTVASFFDKFRRNKPQPEEKPERELA